MKGVSKKIFHGPVVDYEPYVLVLTQYPKSTSSKENFDIQHLMVLIAFKIVTLRLGGS